MKTWFPRPEAATDIVCLGPGGELDAQQLSALLRSPEVIEWREQVGVSSPADGSAKPSRRLLYVSGWVFKTDTTLASEARAQAQATLTSTLQLAARVELWHPDKRWFLLRDEASRRWWPVSVCPMLTTLRSVGMWSNFARGCGPWPWA